LERWVPSRESLSSLYRCKLVSLLLLSKTTARRPNGIRQARCDACPGMLSLTDHDNCTNSVCRTSRPPRVLPDPRPHTHAHQHSSASSSHGLAAGTEGKLPGLWRDPQLEEKIKARRVRGSRSLRGACPPAEQRRIRLHAASVQTDELMTRQSCRAVSLSSWLLLPRLRRRPATRAASTAPPALISTAGYVDHFMHR